MKTIVFAMFMCYANAHDVVTGTCFSDGDPNDRPFLSLADCQKAAAYWQKAVDVHSRFEQDRQTGSHILYKCFQSEQPIQNVWTPTDP
jgi:hypothetical protein